MSFQTALKSDRQRLPVVAVEVGVVVAVLVTVDVGEWEAVVLAVVVAVLVGVVVAVVAAVEVGVVVGDALAVVVAVAVGVEVAVVVGELMAVVDAVVEGVDAAVVVGVEVAVDVAVVDGVEVGVLLAVVVAVVVGEVTSRTSKKPSAWSKASYSSRVSACTISTCSRRPPPYGVPAATSTRTWPCHFRLGKARYSQRNGAA